MNKGRLLIAIGLSFILGITILLVNHETTNALEGRIIRIHGGVGDQVKKIRIDPQTTFVSKGAIVIWTNWARATEVKVIFEEGKRCQDVTDAPTGFKLDAKNCFVTSWIPHGGTSSLKFMQKGTYKYVVEATGGIKERGEIVVRY